MARRRKGIPIHGWLILDKPEGPSSSACVGRLKYLTNAQKVGHGGTLDPLASGVLPLAFGEATKTAQYAMDGRKQYEFTVQWGIQTATDDREGEAVATSPSRPSSDQIVSALSDFIGQIKQRPPAYSAIKVDGQRAYARARRDEDVDIPERDVVIEAFDLIDCPGPDHAVFSVTCGKGTYVRALGRDLALRLGTVGHITRLRRTAVGPFHVERAVSFAAFDQSESPNAAALLSQHLLSVETVLDDIPALAVTEQEARKLRNGQGVAVLPVLQRTSAPRISAGDMIQIMSGGTLVALAHINGGEIRPVRVMNLE